MPGIQEQSNIASKSTDTQGGSLWSSRNQVPKQVYVYIYVWSLELEHPKIWNERKIVIPKTQRGVFFW